MNSVNYPECILNKKKTVNRVTVNFKNLDGVFNAIQKAFENVKVEDVVMKSNNNYGYAAFDTNETVEDLKLESVEGVLKVRVI